MIPVIWITLSTQRPYTNSQASIGMAMKSHYMDPATSPGKVVNDVSELPYTGRPSMTSRNSWKSSGTMRLGLVLTVLQFGFAVYATCLLHWMSANEPEVPVDSLTSNWADPIGKIFPRTSHSRSSPGRTVLENKALEGQYSNVMEIQQDPKSVVCQSEEITFPQKRSNNTKMIDLKTNLFRFISGQHLGGVMCCEILHLKLNLGWLTSVGESGLCSN